MIFVDVIVDISLENLDKTFQYIVPEEWEGRISVGTPVKIPFGRANREIRGYVVHVSDTPKFAVEKTKAILGVEDKGIAIEAKLLSLAYFIKENYGATLNDALKTVLPVKQSVKQKERKDISLQVSTEEAAAFLEECKRKKHKAKARLLEALLEERRNQGQDNVDYDNVIYRLHIGASTVKSLVNSGVIRITVRTRYRNPVSLQGKSGIRKELNPLQRRIAEDFRKEYETGVRKTYLLYGITGSGKTEVYMEMIDAVLERGRQVIVLIPEIALTFQTVNRFYKRFGDRISIVHSRLSKGERYDQYLRAKNGEIDIMIGPRSALFTPFENLGLIIMDEEHEGSYKSEMPPKYHAREVALERARREKASVVLGSATPSIESYKKAEDGEYKLYTLPERAGKGTLPRVHITDLREEFAKGNRSIFGGKLQELMRDRLSKGQQILLFLNRRGYAGFVSCRKCGHVIGCPHCDVSLKAHGTGRQIRELLCHYCGYGIPMPDKCPSCGSPYIGIFGTGTQKVEEMAAKAFPGARILRMDTDTTAGKNGHEKILSQFANKEADILVGTQMIVKGHDFPDVTLVGILAADMSLHVGDYRAAEKTFQLLAQAAGRAGRGGVSGDVVIQTYQPEHYSIQAAAEHDYLSFYKKEIRYRKMLQYPPISNILAIMVSSPLEKTAEKVCEELAGQCRAQDGERSRTGEKNILQDRLQIIGPAKASLAKTKDIYRRVLYLKHNDYDVLRDCKNRIETYLQERENMGRVSVQFDFNPLVSY